MRQGSCLQRYFCCFASKSERKLRSSKVAPLDIISITNDEEIELELAPIFNLSDFSVPILAHICKFCTITEKRSIIRLISRKFNEAVHNQIAWDHLMHLTIAAIDENDEFYHLITSLPFDQSHVTNHFSQCKLSVSFVEVRWLLRHCNQLRTINFKAGRLSHNLSRLISCSLIRNEHFQRLRHLTLPDVFCDNNEEGPGELNHLIKSIPDSVLIDLKLHFSSDKELVDKNPELMETINSMNLQKLSVHNLRMPGSSGVLRKILEGKSLAQLFVKYQIGVIESCFDEADSSEATIFDEINSISEHVLEQLEIVIDENAIDQDDMAVYGTLPLLTTRSLHDNLNPSVVSKLQRFTYCCSCFALTANDVVTTILTISNLMPSLQLFECTNTALEPNFILLTIDDIQSIFERTSKLGDDALLFGTEEENFHHPNSIVDLETSPRFADGNETSSTMYQKFVNQNTRKSLTIDIHEHCQADHSEMSNCFRQLNIPNGVPTSETVNGVVIFSVEYSHSSKIPLALHLRLKM